MLTFLGMEPNGLEDCAYSSRVVDDDALARAASDEPFAHEAVAVLKELLQSVTLVARVRRVDQEGEPRSLSRNEAILAGQMVRLAKLHQGLLEYCSPPRMELFAFVLRGAVETAVNLRYLLEHGSPDVFDAYVQDSLRLDKQLHDRINETVKARSGAVMPMEYGLLEGIERAFRTAGVALDGVSAKSRAAWTEGGIKGRFTALGLERLYASYFAVQSNYVHGAWQELYEHHLTMRPMADSSRARSSRTWQSHRSSWRPMSSLGRRWTIFVRSCHRWTTVGSLRIASPSAARSARRFMSRIGASEGCLLAHSRSPSTGTQVRRQQLPLLPATPRPGRARDQRAAGPARLIVAAPGDR
jgi:Family of unknown function (DUF5677)